MASLHAQKAGIISPKLKRPQAHDREFDTTVPAAAALPVLTASRWPLQRVAFQVLPPRGTLEEGIRLLVGIVRGAAPQLALGSVPKLVLTALRSACELP